MPPAARESGDADQQPSDAPSDGVADVAHFTWVHRHADQRIDLARHPNVKRWYETILARPAVQRGIAVVGA